MDINIKTALMKLENTARKMGKQQLLNAIERVAARPLTFGHPPFNERIGFTFDSVVYYWFESEDGELWQFKYIYEADTGDYWMGNRSRKEAERLLQLN